jgi:hypothetical protein
MRNRPDLIVPIRDRRQRRRIVTLKNFRNVAIIAFVLFIAVTIYSEMRGPKAGEYGRLYSSELPPRVEVRPTEVVQEAATPPAPNVSDQTQADPMLVEPLTREQWLHGETQTADIAASTTIAPPTPVQVTQQGTGNDVTIVGGPEGVAIVRGARKRPLLAGGFGR